MVNATHGAKNCLAGAKNVAGKSNTRLKINRLRLFESVRRVRVALQYQTVVRIAGSGNERADEASVGPGQSKELTCSRVHGATAGARTGRGRSEGNGACAHIKQRRFGAIIKLRDEV